VTGNDTCAATDTHIVIDRDGIARSIIAEFDGTSGNTGMTVDAFLLVNMNDRRKVHLFVPSGFK